VVEEVDEAESGGRIFAQSFQNEVLSIIRDIDIWWKLDFILGLHNLIYYNLFDVFLTPNMEWDAACDKLVGHDANSPNIYLLVVRLTPNNFR
jgi:hypothetical protein